MTFLLFEDLQFDYLLSDINETVIFNKFKSMNTNRSLVGGNDNRIDRN